MLRVPSGRRVIRSVGRRMTTCVAAIWPLTKSDKFVGQATKHSSKLSSFGPRPFRRRIDDRQPSQGDPFALRRHGPVNRDLHARVLFREHFLGAAADGLVHPRIEIGHQERGPDHAGDPAPLEPEPTEVDQALGDNGSDSVSTGGRKSVKLTGRVR